MHEASLYERNCFVTLTYANAPESLNKDDIQKMLKTLRSRENRKAKKQGTPPPDIRYFQCGEYGDAFQRPHHHIIFFNYKPEDSLYFKRQGNHPVYISKTLSEVWPHGMHSIQDLTYDSACYCAKYVLKKINGERAEEHYLGRKPEFITMSRKPGIGRLWYDKFSEDIYNYDKVVLDNNHIFRPPRFYDELHEIHHPSRMRELKQKRRQVASLNPDNCEERRVTRNKLAILREQRQKLRNLENGKTSLLVSPPGGANETGGESA